ncbi:hypothetical protein [Desulforhabdus amnigena]|uniref:Uncharacterized protein n=1 Tax=Desulforhabdus amnigena TaxID=40218 RepID=A0A9W6D174_9BACT|nr:hypothetical protein [Desulforhabdus amnigena]NLJ28883.1 hypothetical protein [Deltaproteobacteria bacterium]GLI33099.1 hypothetical protein DAMNIGENAA_05320 [Desulforhabdus amnigena]
MKEFWESFLHFLKEYDSQKIAGVIRDIDWSAAVRNPWAWVVGVSLLSFLIWKKQIKLMVFGVSLLLLTALLQHTLPPAGESMSLDKLLQFMGGAVALGGVNLYFLFMRES